MGFIVWFSAHYNWISCFLFFILCDACDLLAFSDIILRMRQTFTRRPGQYDDWTKNPLKDENCTSVQWAAIESPTSHVLMCSNARISFQRMSFYTCCTIHSVLQQDDCVSGSERLRRGPIVLLSGWPLARGSFMTHGAGALSARLSSSCLLSWRWLNQVALMQQWWWFQAPYRRD